jgi:hypothetical protein
MLASRDCVIIIPALQDNGTPLTNVTLNVVRTYFTEAIDVGTFIELIGFLNVFSNSGAPTLDVRFQGSPDKTYWMDLGDAFTQVTTTNGMTLKKATANFGKYIRLGLAVGGTTPSYTLNLTLIGKA